MHLFRTLTRIRVALGVRWRVSTLQIVSRNKFKRSISILEILLDIECVTTMKL